jgi:CRP-like cAMP-binding protein
MTSLVNRLESPDPKTNRLLARLASADYLAVMQAAQIVTLKYRKRIHRQEAPVDAVYFPISCMFSLLVADNGQPQLEVATIGREGVVGAAELIHEQGAIGLTLVQIPGAAVRVSGGAFRRLLRGLPMLQALVDKHLYTLTRQIMYGAACNRLHSMEERCARWLLMTHDRAAADTFPLTQDFLSHMLGVRRATVNVATGMLKKAGFIRYVRGKITIIDRPGLESAACGCYRATIRAYEALWPNPRN